MPGPKEKEFPGDPLAFGARYRDQVKSGAETTVPTLGIQFAGRGRVAAILSGAHGCALRTALWKDWDAATTNDPLVILGGFAGLALWPPAGRPLSEHAPARLIRLPMLAFPGQHRWIEQKQKTIEVAWADGTVVADIAAGFRTAVAPASTAFSALCTAIAAGGPSERVLARTFESAIVAEQSFRDRMDLFEPAPLDTTMFYPAAAVSISQLLERARTEKDEPLTLSMLAGTALIDAGKSKPPIWQNFAASLLLRGREEGQGKHEHGTVLQEITPAAAASTLVTLGLDVVRSA